ncbi:glycosyltransferase family 2 protein [Agrilactobacillus fermenti]|uniref:glycosyltransferase family 2 protein n=1 Tax=Agrilactobacillus fermenti TaxID=2586909 RepID=UPI003A5BA78D
MLIFIKITAIISLIVVISCLLVPLILLCLRVSKPKPAATKLAAYQLYLLVPMHNEAPIAEQTLARFLKQNPADAQYQYAIHWVIIEDGSEDTTPDQLLPYDKHHPNVTVIYRHLDAGNGKGSALNTGLEYVYKKVAPVDLEQTVIGVLDADAYIAQADLNQIINIFAADATLSMLQTGIGIYNLNHWLSLLQDFEFQIENTLLQNMRGHLGNVAGSGNGQFFRLSALPRHFVWGATLLEDFEISTKLLLRGLKTAYAYDIKVYQEATITWQTFLRQRARWAQGGLQCLQKFYQAIKTNSNLSVLAKVEMLLFMLTPIICIVAAVLGVIVFGTQLYYWIGLHGSFSWFLLLLLLLMFGENLLLSSFYQRLTHHSWWHILWVTFTLPIYGLFAPIISVMALYRFLQHENKWDKTTHGLF